MNYCILNGVKSTLIKGLLIQSLPPITKPLMRVSTQEIDGRDGDIVTPLGYKAYDKAMTIGLFGDYDINEVIQYFDSEGNVIFSNEPDKYYKYKIINQIDFERLVRFRTANVVFHVQPFKYSAVDDDFSFSINEMKPKIFSASKNGITLTSQNGEISISGTANATVEFYIAINDMTLESGNYTLKGTTEGTGESGVKMRVIERIPTDEDSFGGTYLQLWESGLAELNATLTEAKTFKYIWIQVANGSAVNFKLIPQMINNDVHSCKLVNRGNTTSKPIFTIYGTGDITLSINGKQLFVINMGNNGNITLDGLEMNAYKGDRLMNRLVSGDYSKLMLNAGENIVSWTGNLTQIEIKDVARWI